MPDEDRILLTECRWTGDAVGQGLVERLPTKAEAVRWRSGSREERFALFSKTGFVYGLEDKVGDDWSFFGPEELDALLSPDT